MPGNHFFGIFNLEKPERLIPEGYGMSYLEIKELRYFLLSNRGACGTSY